MFDPTIFDNIKVVLEGEVYELDLTNEILVTKRQDLVNLAKMDREFVLQFMIMNLKKEQKVEIILKASTSDLATEILELEDHNKSGCEVVIHFYTLISDINQSKIIKDMLTKIWQNRKIEQRISYTYDETNSIPYEYLNETILSFGRKINEDNISDIHDLVKYTVHSLKEINKTII